MLFVISHSIRCSYLTFNRCVILHHPVVLNHESSVKLTTLKNNDIYNGIQRKTYGTGEIK